MELDSTAPSPACHYLSNYQGLENGHDLALITRVKVFTFFLSQENAKSVNEVFA